MVVCRHWRAPTRGVFGKDANQHAGGRRRWSICRGAGWPRWWGCDHRRRCGHHGLAERGVSGVVATGWDELVGVRARDHGVGDVGFAGTAPRQRVRCARGLMTLTDDGFGGGVRVPVLPYTWAPGGVEAMWQERGDAPDRSVAVGIDESK